MEKDAEISFCSCFFLQVDELFKKWRDEHSKKKPANDCQVIFTKSQPDPAFLFEKELRLSLPIDDEVNLFICVFNSKPSKKS